MKNDKKPNSGKQSEAPAAPPLPAPENVGKAALPGVVRWFISGAYRHACAMRKHVRHMLDAQRDILPSPAVQVSQTGPYVFVVENGVAKVRPVTVDRTLDMQSVITKGLSGGETVVRDGQLQLVDGSRVAPRSGGKPGA